MTDYEIARPTGKCHLTGRDLAEGERFYSAIFETADGFERRDFCEDAWEGPPPDALCHFQTRLPKKEERRRTFVDDEVLISFFQNLADATDPAKLRFRFVLALILLRKRLLKYERTLHQAEGEFWEMRLMRDKSSHRVFNPVLTDEEIGSLTAQLGVVLSSPFDESDDVETDDPTPAAAEAIESPDPQQTERSIPSTEPAS